MLKNISDYISLATLLFMTVYALRVFVFAITRNEEDEDNTLSRRQLIRDYINNTEE